MSELAGVQKGISWVYYGLYLIVASILVLMLSAMASAAIPSLAGLFLLLPILMIVGGTIMGAIGRLMCLSVPPDTQARSFIFASVTCDITSVAATIASFAIALPPEVDLASKLLALVANMLFLVFLKSVAELAKDPKSFDLSKQVLSYCIATFAFGLISPFIPFLALFAAITALVAFFKYIRLLMGLMESLKTA